LSCVSSISPSVRCISRLGWETEETEQKSDSDSAVVRDSLTWTGAGSW
jgi:hypothetical protein